MKNLKEYVNEGLADWGEDDKLNKKISKQTSKSAIMKEIRNWIKANYYYVKVNSLVFNFDTFPITVDYTREELYIKHGVTSLTNGMFQWGEIDGVFYCGNSRIKNFEGGPKKVNNTFNCDHCSDLVDMKGVPDYIGGTFYCHQCPNLQHITLPEYVENGTSFGGLPSLKDNLEKMAQKVQYPVYLEGKKLN
jgi:hypothetical protein